MRCLIALAVAEAVGCCGGINLLRAVPRENFSVHVDAYFVEG